MEKLLWILSIFSALILFVLIGSHVLLMHAGYQVIPLCPYAYATLAVLASFHGIYGLRSVFIEKLGYSKRLDVVFSLVFVCISALMLWRILV